MAMPDTILTPQGDIIVMLNVLKISISGNSIVINYISGASLITTQYTYPDLAAAQAAFANYVAQLQTVNISLPVLHSVSPATFAAVSLPQNFSATGVSFDPSAVITIILPSPAGSVVCATTFVNSTTLTVTIPGGTGAGTYDVNYSDTLGNSSTLGAAMVIT